MDTTKAKKIIVKMVVTFLEAALAFASVSGWNLTDKTVQAGIIGAGLSAVYNLTKHYLSEGV